MNLLLSPTQQTYYDKAIEILHSHNILVFWAPVGLGKSTILKAIQQKMGGSLLTIRDFLQCQSSGDSLSLFMNALEKNDLVLVDDLHLFDRAINPCPNFSSESALGEIVMHAICSYATESHKKIVFAHTGKASQPVDNRCIYIGFDRFSMEDYRFLCSIYLGKKSQDLDFHKIYHFAPRLNGHQIKAISSIFNSIPDLKTDLCMNYLLEHHLASNVSIAEVEKTETEGIKGVDHILRSLETHVVIPLERSCGDKNVDLKMSKGVLLYGPPGTGKTSIGRMLAHRMKGKFFSIDGRFICNTQEFYGQVREIFKAARQNAPGVIFIDESDVIWENSDTGFYRYLLTELDGLEGNKSGMICVIMTAMDLAKIPQPLIRSGRIGLWLELPLPNEEVRNEILKHWIGKLPGPLNDVDVNPMARQTEGFSGADLRRIVEDVQNLYAYDMIHQNPMLAAREYFSIAIKTIHEYLSKKEKAEANLKSEHARMAQMPFLPIAEFFARFYRPNSPEQSL